VVLSCQIGVSSATAGMRGLDQRGSEPGIPLAGLTTLAFAGTLVVPRTHASPGGEVCRGREAPHVQPDLCDQHLGRAPTDAGDGVQTVQSVLKGARRNALRGGAANRACPRLTSPSRPAQNSSSCSVRYTATRPRQNGSSEPYKAPFLCRSSSPGQPRADTRPGRWPPEGPPAPRPAHWRGPLDRRRSSGGVNPAS
jgi:hypothetical protein